MRFCIVLAVFLTSFGVMADSDWDEVAKNGDVEVIYLNDRKEKLNANEIKVLILDDLKETDKNGIRSVVALNVIDCKNATIQAVSRVAYSGPMASGSVVGTIDKAEKPTAVVLGTILDGIFENVCKTK